MQFLKILTLIPLVLNRATRWFCCYFLISAVCIAIVPAAFASAMSETAIAPKAIAVPPDAPQGVTARASFVKAIAISWKPVAGATSYTIQHSVSGEEGSFTLLTTVAADVHYYRHTGLELNQKVYYKVSTSANGVASAFSEAVSATTNADAIIRIMPLGDSNTEGGSGSIDPANRIGYRKDLYKLLVEDGKVNCYKIDFVGSEQMGQNFQSEFKGENGFELDIDHAGFGGARNKDINILLRDGRFPFYDKMDDYRGLPEGEGPYLDKFNPDIILLHTGTNWVDSSENAMNDVKNILDQVDTYEANANKEVIVVVAKIIKRVCYLDDKGYNQCTTPTEAENTLKYNINLEEYIKSRIEGGDRLLLVDMEDGAGIDYKYKVPDGGDMADYLHPAQSGYDKMAQVWFNALSSPQVPLPVELLEFEADYQEHEVLLNWSTASELHNNQFEVQRMQEGQSFEAIGTVAGAGTSNRLRHYAFRDASAPAGQLYYRLKQVDDDGAYTYSKIVSVRNVAVQERTATLFPNPTDGSHTVRLHASGFEPTSRVYITLLNPMGRKLYVKAVQTGGMGELETEMALPAGLARGLYLCELRSAGDVQRLKLLVQ